MYCNCGNKIEEARLELKLELCRVCAFAGPDLRPKGRIVYGHKTGGQIEIMTKDTFELLLLCRALRDMLEDEL